MSAHTPGPWAVEAGWNDPGQFTVTAPTHYSGERGVIASTDGTPWLERREANARLISAAPDLLAAMEALLSERYACESIILDAEGKPETFDSNGNWTCNSPASVAARAAIAKARGEA